MDIEVKLLTEDEARIAKLDGYPDFTITTEPDGANIKVNGEDVGKSPVTIHDVKFGSDLNIEASLDDKSYRIETRTYTVTKGGDPQMKVVIQKAESAVAAAPEVTKPAQPRPKKPAATKPKDTASGNGTGYISVKAVPWATVNIDSVRVGTTPVTKKSVKSGSHKVEIVFPSKKLKQTKTVNIKSGQHVSIGYNFDEKKWM